MTEQVGYATVQINRPHRRGAAWWLLVGWWWAPACWAGRVTLWVFAWPLGLWRSIRHGQRKQARR
jgi:hypothetical protein